MSHSHPLHPGFRDRAPEQYHDPDVNPYLKLHRSFGPPVIVGEDGPGYRGRWADAFEGRQAPLHVEIGPGNGFFLSGMAALHPEQNWLGIEIRFKRVILCARKIKAANVTNARILRYDAWHLDDLFTEGALDGLYTNHPDPWPKERHEKNRLMGPFFAGWAARALRPGARWRLKTDYPGNVERVIEGIAELPFRVVGQSADIRALGAPWPAEDDVITNYQRKFYARNEPVYALEVERLPTPPAALHPDDPRV